MHRRFRGGGTEAGSQRLLRIFSGIDPGGSDGRRRGFFVLLGVGGSGWMLASTTMVLEFGNVEDIPMRLAFVTTLEGVIAATGPVLAGVLVATSGFKPLFAIVLAAVIAALIFLIWKVREPRHPEPAI